MYNIDMNTGGHTWVKQNLVTITKKRGSYDIFKCSLCGIEGKSTSISTIGVKSTYSEERVYNCSGNKFKVPKRIKITHCTAFGSQFKNLKHGSEHDVITPPEGYHNDHSGVWVMGVGEPVRVLSNEFEILKT